MQFTVNGKRWKFRWVTKTEQRNAGECDPPKQPGKEIRVRKDQPIDVQLEALIHEQTHAAGWHIDEGFVREFARDCARNIIKSGWKPE